MLFADIVTFALQSLPTMDDLCVHGLDPVSVSAYASETGWKLLPTDENWFAKKTFIEALQEFVFMQGGRLDPMCPSAGGGMQVGGVHFRWHALITPVCVEGGLLALRRSRLKELTLDHFQVNPLFQSHWDSLYQNLHGLWFIAGPTGSGKTSLLSALLSSTFIKDRVIILEEFSEIPRMSPFWTKLVKPSIMVQDSQRSIQEGVHMHDLLQDTLRLKPDVLVFGEIRTHAHMELVKEASLSGHKAVFATVHALDYPSFEKRFFNISFEPVKPKFIFLRSKAYVHQLME